jgi:hypothetical protein
MLSLREFFARHSWDAMAHATHKRLAMNTNTTTTVPAGSIAILLLAVLCAIFMVLI